VFWGSWGKREEGTPDKTLEIGKQSGSSWPAAMLGLCPGKALRKKNTNRQREMVEKKMFITESRKQTRKAKRLLEEFREGVSRNLWYLIQRPRGGEHC